MEPTQADFERQAIQAQEFADKVKAMAADAPYPQTPPAPGEDGRLTASSGAPDNESLTQCSDRIDAIAAALAKAQGQIANPTKGAINPHFKSQYADLASGLNAIRSALSANGIAVIQTTRMVGDTLMLHSMLAHSSGQWIGSQWPVCKLPASPQVIGSALTYARRYTLFPLVGIAGEGDDDDANAATAATAVPIDPDQIAYLEQSLRDTGSDVQRFLATIGAPSVAELTTDQYKRGIALLSEKKRRMVQP